MNKKVDGWFIYSNIGINSGTNFLNTMKKRALEYGVSIEILNYEDISLVAGESLEMYYKGEKIEYFPNFVFLRTMSITIGRFLKEKGIKIINDPESMVIAKDKFRIHLILSNNNIHTPKTLFPKKNKLKYKEVVEILGTPFVAKDNFGSRGRGVKLIKNKEEYIKIKHNKNYIYQEYIKSTYGKDLRIYVLDGEILGCVQRNAAKSDEFRANISQGGYAIPYELDDKIKNICLKVAELLGFDFTGIDLLFTEEGYTVCEINSIAAFTSLRVLKDVLFSKRFFEYINKHNKFIKE